MTCYTIAMRTALLASLLALAACGQSSPPADAAASTDAPPDTDFDPCDWRCSAVQLCCDGATGFACVDYYSDPANCGGCGIACDPGAVCVGRMCVAT